MNSIGSTVPGTPHRKRSSATTSMHDNYPNSQPAQTSLPNTKMPVDGLVLTRQGHFGHNKPVFVWDFLDDFLEGVSVEGQECRQPTCSPY